LAISKIKSTAVLEQMMSIFNTM